jgi:hypothetical protein
MKWGGGERKGGRERGREGRRKRGKEGDREGGRDMRKTRERRSK